MTTLDTIIKRLDECDEQRRNPPGALKAALLPAARQAAADLAALRLEHDAHAVLLDCARRDRDEARAEANTLHIELSNVRESYANSTRRHADLQRLLNDNTSDLPASVRNRVIPGSCVTDEAGRLLVSVAVERDALRAQLAEAKTLGDSQRKATAAGYDRCTADVVAYLRKHAAGMVLVNQHDNVRMRGNCYLNAANMIERDEHIGAKERA